MNHIIAEFPQDKFRFRIFDNLKKLTWQQIKAQTGCYALINLAYFNMATFSTDDHVMIAGKWAQEPTWSDHGILIDADGALTVGTEREAVYDYCRGEPTYYFRGSVKSGAKHVTKNGLTMLGVKETGDVDLLLSPRNKGMSSRDGTTALLERGCTTVMRFDGSWSTQGSLGPGLDVDPTQERKVRTYLLVFQRNEKNEEDKPMNDHAIAGVTQNFMTYNPCYSNGETITPKGIMVHSTASPGLMAQALRDRWNKESARVSVHAMIDDTVTLQTLPWRARAWHCGSGTTGSSANSTHIAFEVCEPQECRLIPIEWVPQKRGGEDNTAWAVTRIQQELVARGYDPKGVDGSFGPGCEAAVKKFQKDQKLTVDGSVGPATRKALANREGSYLKYDPAKVQDYFQAVWDRSVALCVELCREYGLNPEKDILCHSEGYKAKIATNHADVTHWWPLHGKSMDDFRAAVKAALEANVSKPNTVTCPHCGGTFQI